MNFDHRHYVAVLKGKKAEYGALHDLHSVNGITPLIEAIPSQELETVVANMDACWPKGATYFVDGFFHDDEEREYGAEPHPLVSCFENAEARGHIAIPVTGLGRSAAYQKAVAFIAKKAQRGIAVRLVPEDFEDEQDLNDGVEAVLELSGLDPSQVDMVIDRESVLGTSTAVVAQTVRATLELVPRIGEWRTLTVLAGAFPLGLSELVKGKWNRVVRNDWLAWVSLLTGRKALARKPSYGDYNIAHPALPPEGQATVLAQLRYTADTEFLIWKGENAVKKGFEQFNTICGEALKLPEYMGSSFSAGDREISEKAAKKSSPGNATTWRRIGVSHHLEMAIHQIAILSGL